jgi:hypothetical protein
MRFRTEGLVVGLGLIVLGLLWTLANLGRIDLLATLRTWWPALLVLWGVVELVRTLTRRRQEEARK